MGWAPCILISSLTIISVLYLIPNALGSTENRNPNAMLELDKNEACNRNKRSNSSAFNVVNEQLIRDKRNVHPRHPKSGYQAPQQATDKITKISVPACTEEGVLLIQGQDQYFLKCTQNPATGGYFQIVYICPAEMHSVADTSSCIPPPDCTQCGATVGTTGDNPNGLVYY